MAQKVREELTTSQFNIAAQGLGFTDTEDLPPSYAAAKAVLCFGYRETEVASLYEITPQGVSYAVRRVVDKLKAIPGEKRLCAGCGRPLQERSYTCE